MREHVEKIATSHDNIHNYICYSNPSKEDIEKKYHHKSGFITEKWLKSILPTLDCDYYFCGPPQFMRVIYSMLHKLKAPESQIYYEFFGPALELEKN